MKTCDKCEYCYEQSNHYKGAKIHTIHYRCHLKEKAVNPYNSCEMWIERKGKMEIRYKYVLCKDCKYWQEPVELDGYTYPSQCTRDERADMEECNILMDADDFCSRGELK